ncbi:MAG: class I SAM-dependent methyltransferase [Chloroflexi bacterium]|nr:class I SAM-dependent methyltransferase [Chloroflexota bacterium]
METIRGKTSLDLDFNGLTERLAGYNRIILDLGTGDGRYVHFLADKFPGQFIIGVDPCRENLHEHSRAKLPNMLFVIASAQDLPRELTGLVSHVTINFPWGSLLDSLLTGDASLMCGLESISNSIASVDVRLNGGALVEAGWALEAGAEQIYNNMIQAGWQVEPPVMMNTDALRSFPSTWAKRLSFGRDPRAMMLSGWLAQAQSIECRAVFSR